MFVEFRMFCSSNKIAIFTLNSAVLVESLTKKEVEMIDIMTPYRAYTATSLIWLRPVSGRIRDINELAVEAKLKTVT